jgi:hypothetical protein
MDEGWKVERLESLTTGKDCPKIKKNGWQQAIR